MKKRSCRRTEKESELHDRAVKIRKMTDEQLCEYVDRKEQEAAESAYKRGLKEAEKSKDAVGSVKDFLEEIQKSKIPGVGTVTINKLKRAAAEHGYI